MVASLAAPEPMRQLASLRADWIVM